ncbi:MAG: glycosyltransferase family 2 protein [Pseudomonadota bacterium]
MGQPTFSQYLRSADTTLPKGPVALIIVEDDVGVGATIRHHARIGFKNIIVIAEPDISLPADCEDLCSLVTFTGTADNPAHAIVNAAIEALPGRWLFYCYNAEFLHFPFCETRSVSELITFITEERRSSAFTYVIDLYSDDLTANPLGYSLETAHLDGSGYYALTRDRGEETADRQLSIYGGLKWRFEEHLPLTKRRIDRVALFQAEKGLTMDADQLLSDEELNTFQCPWHHSATITVCSFRTAKYLKVNPGSTYAVTDFMWSGSEKFHWNSQQLMDLGLMEPGQWF